MKTYQDYYNEWQDSTESRDLAFDEWLMLQLDKKERKMIDKACEWLINTYLGDYVTDEFGNGGIGDNVKLAEDFRKAMEE